MTERFDDMPNLLDLEPLSGEAEVSALVLKQLPPDMRMNSFGCRPVNYTFYMREAGATIRRPVLILPEVDHTAYFPILRLFVDFWRRSLHIALDSVDVSIMDVERRGANKPMLLIGAEKLGFEGKRFLSGLSPSGLLS
ncbi:MAG: hypothetical protein DI585_04010 [Pseudomonas fluorescens]|nr:MAG: hypothetical protein DI585_04010 [Pseudomonas fluorescens]